MLQEPAYLILTALSHAPAHGYAIMNTVAALSDDRVRLRPGTLYAALERFEHQGWVVVETETPVDGRLRKTYRLTDEGASVLAEEADQLASNARMAKRALAIRLRTKRA